MLEGNQFVETVEDYFAFLEAEFNFNVSDEKILGNTFYDVKYKDEARIVSVSYENIEDYLLVIIFILLNGELPDYDDKTKTLHLSQLNATILSRVDKNKIYSNTEYFLRFSPKNELERELLKSAKELRMYLKYFDCIVNIIKQSII